MTSIDNSDSLSIELSFAFVTGILSKLHDRFLPLSGSESIGDDEIEPNSQVEIEIK